MKDGTVHTGFVEPGGAAGELNLHGITGLLLKLPVADVVKPDVSEQSMMPANLKKNSGKNKGKKKE